MLKWICRVTKADRIKNEYTRGSLEFASIFVEKVRK